MRGDRGMVQCCIRVAVVCGTFVLGGIFSPNLLAQEDFSCEVMGLEGKAHLSNMRAFRREIKDGDLVQAGDIIEVDPGGYVDLAYDGDWTNVIRIEEGSAVKIASVYPGGIELQRGGIFAKLSDLPKESTFEVRTPTAIAAARGTEYFTTYEDGTTSVSNFSGSDVYVFGLSPGGAINQDSELLLKADEGTEVASLGQAPLSPFRVKQAYRLRGLRYQRELGDRVLTLRRLGRRASIQDLRRLRAARITPLTDFQRYRLRYRPLAPRKRMERRLT